MAAPIPPMLKYSVVNNFINPPILITFVSKLIVCKVLYFKAQYYLRLRAPGLQVTFKERNWSLQTTQFKTTKGERGVGKTTRNRSWI